VRKHLLHRPPDASNERGTLKILNMSKQFQAPPGARKARLLAEERRGEHVQDDKEESSLSRELPRTADDHRCEITPSVPSVGEDATLASMESDPAPCDARPTFVFEDESKFLNFCARSPPLDETTPSGALSLSYTLRMGNILCLAHDSLNLTATTASLKTFFEKLQRQATLTAKHFLEHSMSKVTNRSSADVDQKDALTSKTKTNEEYDVLGSHECEEARGESEPDDWSFVSYDA